MELYKVDFINNVPERAVVVSKGYYKELTKVEKLGDQLFLKWLYVHADHENDAMKSADRYKNAILNQVRCN